MKSLLQWQNTSFVCRHDLGRWYLIHLQAVGTCCAAHIYWGVNTLVRMLMRRGHDEQTSAFVNPTPCRCSMRTDAHVASGAIGMYNEAIDIPNKHPALLTTAGARDDGT